MKLKVIAIVLLVFTAVALAANHLRCSAGQQRPKIVDQLKNLDPPTPIQEGVMTTSQRQHSKLFGGYRKDMTRGRTLHELVLEKGDVQVGRGVGNVILPSSFNIDDYLERASCQSEAIVIGTVRDKSTNLIDDGSFTFTEYTLMVEEVLKDNSATHIQPSYNITVVRASGSVKLLGHVARAVDYAQQPLAIGQRYLLFLGYVPATGGYRSLRNAATDDSFKLDGNEIRQVSSQPFPFGPDRPTDGNSFSMRARLASKNPCQK